MKEFFAMGGYAFYVWTSYGIAFIVLVLNLVDPYLKRRNLLSDIARRMRREKRSGSPTVSSSIEETDNRQRLYKREL